MRDENGVGGSPGPARLGLSRRGFLYGTAAAVAAGVLIERLPLGLAGTAAGSTGAGFSFVQAGPQSHGAGRVDLALNTASAAGTMLVAVVTGTDPAVGFTAPAGWRLAKALRCAAGRAEIWYYPGVPPAPGNPGRISSATFTGSAGTSCRGAMCEFSLPAGTMPVLEAPGQAIGTSGGVFDLSAAAGNTSGALGVAVVADFFDAPVPPGHAWTAPQDWSEIRHLGEGVADCWAAWYDLSLATGPQSLTASFGYAGGQSGWVFAFAAFRAVRFQALHLDGGEMTTMVALDPTGQELVMGGDVEGLWRTADFGDHWQLSQNGLYGQNWRCTASVAWSLLEPHTVYACVGKSGNDGGLLVSVDGGLSWSMRSAAVQFRGNAAGAPQPRPTSEAQDADRSVGNLLAQDPKGGFLYAATYNGGIARSSASHPPVGSSWTVAGLSETGFYPRALVINPSNTQELWAGCWDSDGTGTFGGVWHCTSAQTATSTSAWSQLPGFSNGTGTEKGTVADLKILGGYLYAACPKLGIFRHRIGGTGWTSLNGTVIDTSTSLWTSLDGYVDPATNNHILIAGCGNGVKASGNPNYTNLVQITITPHGALTWADLTGNADINVTTVPPDDRTWWRHGSSWHYWLGGAAFVNPHILIDPHDPKRIYVTGAGGFFRTFDGGKTWTIACNGAPMARCALISVDPNNPDHVILAGSDFTQTDLTDPTGWDTSKVQGTHPPGSAIESHAIAFDPHSNVFTAVNAKYGKNSGGAVYWRATGDATFTWHDTGYSAAVPTGNAPMGIFTGLDGAGTPYLAVVAQGAGMYRATPNGALTDPWSWSRVNTLVGTKGNVGQHCPLAAGTGATDLYCFDRAQGIWRSTDHAQSWTLIWAVTAADPRSGWLAVNPAVGGELWVATNNGLYKLGGADSGTVGNGITLTQLSSTQFPHGAGGIVFTPAATPYVVSLNGPAQPSPRLLATTDGGASWTNAGGDSVSSYASWPGSIAVTAQGLILLASDEDFAVYATPAG